MKPSSRDYPLGLASPLNYAAIQSGNIKNPSNKEAGLDVSHHTLVSREGRGENVFLDILFNRMSEIENISTPKVQACGADKAPCRFAKLRYEFNFSRLVLRREPRV
jgi:hypothetical protein